MLDSTESEEEAIQLAKEVAHIHSKAGFTISKWVSNSPKVMSALYSPVTSTQKNLSLLDTYTKVLGMKWCTNSDTFMYSIEGCALVAGVCKKENSPTKREVLRVLMTIFDPLGLISNTLIFLKVLLQYIWRSGIG